MIALLAATGCDRVLSIPELPDLEPLARRYDSPDGSLAETAVEAVIAEAERRQRIAEDLGRLEMLTDLVEELRASEALPIRIDGGVAPDARPTLVATLRHICRGPPGYDESPDAEAHGTLTLTVVAGGAGVWPVVAGDFEACVGRSGSSRFEIDGRVTVRLDQLEGQRRLLARIAGRVLTERDAFEGNLDFRIGEQRLEVRVPISSGDVIAGLADRANTQLVRDRVATWTCAVQRLRCERTDNGEVLEADGE